jgi:hypothetical protein
MNNSLLIIGLIVLLVFSSGCVKESTISEQEAEKIAEMTEEVQSFLDYYSYCKGCNPAYSEGYENLIGCVEYSIDEDSKKTYDVEYWVSEACSFRYGSSLPQVKIKITVDLKTGEILEKYPDIEYIKDPDYCKKDSDCMCKSGSGVKFVGCGNFFHAPTHFAGSYVCEVCKCLSGSCKYIN